MHLWLKKNHNTESWNIYFYKPWYFQKEYNWLKLHYSLIFLPVKNFQFLQYMTWKYLLTTFGKIKRSDVHICSEPPNPLRYAVKLLYWERKYFFNYTWFYYLLRLVVRHNMELSTIHLLNIKHVEIWIKKMENYKHRYTVQEQSTQVHLKYAVQKSQYPALHLMLWQWALHRSWSPGHP